MKTAMLVLCATLLCLGQDSQLRSISGTVLRRDGNPFPPVEGADVTVFAETNPEKKVATTITNKHGQYKIDSLAPGKYRLEFAADGLLNFPQVESAHIRGDDCVKDTVLFPNYTGNADHDRVAFHRLANAISGAVQAKPPNVRGEAYQAEWDAVVRSGLSPEGKKLLSTELKTIDPGFGLSVPAVQAYVNTPGESLKSTYREFRVALLEGKAVSDLGRRSSNDLNKEVVNDVLLGIGAEGSVRKSIGKSGVEERMHRAWGETYTKDLERINERRRVKGERPILEP
jgi:carboxypeptidase family protein